MLPETIPSRGSRAGGRRRRWLGAGLDLLLIAAFVVAFYRPYLERGLPSSDFGPTVTNAEISRLLIPTLADFPTWNPYLMCGRPTIGFTSPFSLLYVPFRGLEPIARKKAIVVLFNVFSGLLMYLLVRDVGAGRWAAILGGLAYPITAHHVTRTAVYAHMKVPMFYAFVPLLFLLLFRARWSLRAVAGLGLGLGGALMRDPERTVLLALLLGIELSVLALAAVVRALRGGEPIRRAPALRLLAVFVAGFALGTAIVSFDVGNDFAGDPYRGGWVEGEQARHIRKWSLENLLSVVDRDAVVASSLAVRGLGFEPSRSRYVGLSLLVLATLGALDPTGLGRRRRPFWLAFALLPLALWLSFGPRPILPTIAPRWLGLLRSPDLPWPGKAAVAAAAAVAVALAVAIAARYLRRRPGRWWRALAATTAVLAALALVAPFPWLQRVAIVLRDFRNPSWFEIAVLPFAVCFPAALGFAAVAERLARRRLASLMWLLAIPLCLVDLSWGRRLLREGQRSDEYVTEIREAGETIGSDPADVRVLGADRSSKAIDTAWLWHHKRLAWDYRSYSAPRRTHAYMYRLFERIEASRLDTLTATLAGLADVGYLIDRRRHRRDLRPTADLELVDANRRMAVFRNRAHRPWVQAYRGYHLLVGESPRRGVDLAGQLAMRGIGLLQVDHLPPATAGDDLTDTAGGIWFDPTRTAPAPARGAPLGESPPEVEPAPPWTSPPRLDWRRPAPERILVDIASQDPFLLVVAESFHPWWRAELDGTATTLRPGEYAFLGVRVPAGDHVVELRFRRPPMYWIWGLVSVVSLVAAIGYLLHARGRLQQPPLLAAGQPPADAGPATGSTASVRSQPGGRLPGS